MSDELEASQGPSAESPVPGEIVEALTPAEPAEEMSLDDELAAVWDKTEQGEQPEDEAAAKQENAEDESDKDDSEPDPAAQIDFPTELPSALKEHWANIPEAARAAIHASQTEMSNKVSAASRELSAFRPIRGALEQVTREHPALSSMTPEAVAAQIPGLVTIGQNLKTDPVNTILQVAQNNGVLDQLAHVLTGQGAAQGAGNEAALLQKIAQLEGKLQQISDPNRLEETFNSFYRKTSIEQEVAQFAGETENWSEIEGLLPQTIPLAQSKLGENASNRAVLEEATKLAIQVFLPEKAQQSTPVPEAEVIVDPAKVQKAKDAKSVNVKAKSAGKARSDSLDDELGKIYDRAAS